MKKTIWLPVLFLAAVLFGCSGEGATVAGDLPFVPDVMREEAGAEDATVTSDSGRELEPGDGTGQVDVAGEDAVAFDVNACQGGTGCWGEPCAANKDCQSGICLLHMGEMVCSEMCVEECPSGFECRSSTLFGPDTTFVCESRYPALCLPCKATADCEELAGLGSACVKVPGEGFFCGSGCFADSDCAQDYECLQVPTVDGLLTTQCMAVQGQCGCSGHAAGQALSTVCSNENEFGLCDGTRTCGSDGLSECNAAIPAAEVCDGADNDCNGLADDVSCDDNQACTTDWCDPETGCVNEPQTGGECLDGNACTFGDHCDAGECVGAPLNCDDDNPCTTELCDEALGCQYEFTQDPCDDGNPCTWGDTCLGGQCVGLPGICQCQKDGDCVDAAQGNLCLGQWYCDKSESPYVCKIVPGSAVKCDKPEGVHKLCYANQCNPESGQCEAVPANQGALCTDGDGCTIGEQCLDAQCTGGGQVQCGDGNPCTDDLCQAAFGCIHLPNVDSCNDGDACTYGDHCSDGGCIPGVALQCDDGNVCTGDSCDPQVGCQHVPVQDACDDGNKCTTGDKCQAGWCAPQGALDCDDGNACTDDSCSPVEGCLHAANSALCSDGSACTAPDKCVAGQCAPGPSLDCDDGNVCTDDSCSEDTGCVHLANNTGCSDGNECTKGDQCQAGWCVFDSLEDCSDGNPCTDEVCDPEVGCVISMNKGPCDDGDLCTVGDSCALGECMGGPALLCDDGNICTTDQCKPGVGCEFVPTAGQCEDGNACTLEDVCSAGKCVAGKMLKCDDSNPCTADSCDPAVGCTEVATEGECSDGNPCTVADLCVNGECQAGPQMDCDDDNVCTQDACDPQTLCTNSPVAGGCDDEDVCTQQDSCVAGKCVGSAPLDCNLGELCTSYTCHPVDGCQATPEAPCCGNNVQENPEECDDGNANNGDGCSANCLVENTVKCSNNSTVDCNPGGVTLIPSSAFVDQNPPAGWTQCAGFTNTSGNDVSANLLGNCMNTSRLRVKVWNSGGVLEEDVYDQDISLGSSFPDWNYLGGGSMDAKPKFTYWTGNTTYFCTTTGTDACGKSVCPSGTPTLGTGNGDTALIAPGNTGPDEWRVNCNGQSLPDRNIAVYR